jgi:hypothetical protein
MTTSETLATVQDVLVSTDGSEDDFNIKPAFLARPARLVAMV